MEENPLPIPPPGNFLADQTLSPLNIGGIGELTLGGSYIRWGLRALPSKPAHQPAGVMHGTPIVSLGKEQRVHLN